MVDEAYQSTEDIVRKYKDKLEAVAKLLLEKEILSAVDMTSILGARDEKRHFGELTYENPTPQ